MTLHVLALLDSVVLPGCATAVGEEGGFVPHEHDGQARQLRGTQCHLTRPLHRGRSVTGWADKQTNGQNCRHFDVMPCPPCCHVSPFNVPCCHVTFPNINVTLCDMLRAYYIDCR